MNVFAFFLVSFFLSDVFSAKNSPQCPQIKIKFGRVRYRQRGKFARYLCNTGYTLAGDRYSVCLHGQWDNTPPRCVRATCKDTKSPANLLIYPSHGGAVLNFFCKNSYHLKGPSITYCDGDNWDNPLPTCRPTNATSLSCDFEEEDLCGWNHDLNHDFDWTRMNYATPSGTIGTGPSHDHTKGAGKDGFYMYIESSARNINDTARLISPVFDRSDDSVCFEFYYHMYGVATGDLRVFLKKVNQTWNFNPKNAVFNKKGNQGNRWFRGFIELGPVDDDFQIIIEGVRGSSYVSDIAIDDVRIIENCIPDEYDATTTEESSSDPPIGVESCENRCNTTDNRDGEYLITCDCDDRCFDRNRCCPDYFDFCVSGTSPDGFDETISSSTSTSSIPETPATVKTTSTSTTVTTSTPTTTTRKKESKIVYVTPDDDVDEVPVENSSEPETPAVPIKETEFVSENDSDKTVHQKIVVVPKMSENNTKTVIFAVGVVFGVLFAAVGTAFVARRYRLFACAGLRRFNQSSNGDSQSDVRFLTGDEVLDLNLPSGYDTL